MYLVGLLLAWDSGSPRRRRVRDGGRERVRSRPKWMWVTSTRKYGTYPAERGGGSNGRVNNSLQDPRLGGENSEEVC